MKKEIEKEKVVAEKLNGRLAMLGIIAGLGAYLTTGQNHTRFRIMNRHPVPLKVVPYIFAMALASSTFTSVFA